MQYPERNKCEYSVRALTLNKLFASPDHTEQCLRKIARECGLELVGREGKYCRLEPVSPGGFKSLLPQNRWATIRGLLSLEPLLEFVLRWSAPDEFMLPVTERVDLAFYIEPGRGYDFSMELFRSTVDTFLPYWAELNEQALTSNTTFSGLNAHSACVPRLGTADYFGPDYCDFYGGIAKLKRAGFAHVEEHRGGCYVVLPKAKDASEFKEIQAQVQANLGPPELFVTDPYGPAPDFREWYEDGAQPVIRRQNVQWILSDLASRRASPASEDRFGTEGPSVHIRAQGGHEGPGRETMPHWERGTMQEPDADTFVDPGLGFSIRKPSDWHFRSTEEVIENRSRVRLDDAALEDAVQKRASLPLVVISKRREPENDVDPTVQVGVRPLGPMQGRTPDEILTAAVTPLKGAFADFEFIEPVHPVSISGHGAASMTATYTLTTDTGDSFEVLSLMWVVPRGRIMFMIGMAGPASGPDISTGEFKAILESVVIAAEMHEGA